MGALDHLGITAFVTTRHGGVSAPPFDTLNLGDHVGDRWNDVLENRRRVAAAADVELDRLIIVRQTHGTDVVDADDPQIARVGDVIVTTSSDVALAILVADCTPIILVNPATHTLAVVHAGWRGLAAGVIRAGVDALGEPRGAVRAVIGPCISGLAYQVGPEVANHFTHVPDALTDDVGDRSRLDLKRIATHDLCEAGVADDAIVVTNDVTDGGHIYFSDRAQRPCGRVAVVARWCP